MTAPLSEVLAAVQRLAPLQFAEPWDNVGLLLEPQPLAQASVRHALLTVDLSDAVVEEARQLGVTLIIAYHPPIFQGLKRLRSSVAEERALLRCAAHNIAIYSPHTALDAAPEGVNDWLLDAFPVVEHVPCSAHPADGRYGPGRLGRLKEPLSLAAAVLLVKQHLGLSRVRVATALTHEGDEALIRKVAVCAGAGGSVFEKLGPGSVDLLLTGEMRHHDVRARTQSGTSVVLCDHTNTERGYLPIFAKKLDRELGDVTFHVSTCDRDPLVIV